MARPPTLAARLYWRTVWLLGIYAFRGWLSADARAHAVHQAR
jgi:hypothetical protein